MIDPSSRLATALADHYRLERELGAGGMATVYLAHDLKHDRDVAIKVLHADLGAALGAERFLSEIRTTARLQHPHILPLLDSGDADGLLYFVMPLVTGETLRARLDRERQLPIADALRITREVADALSDAHAHGIIHRDIKPENILLQGGHALVADFGIALAVQTANGERLTRTGMSLGTPQYMSPEQALGERTVDARSDVYALAAVTYEMLSGTPPFTGPSAQAILSKIMTEKPVSLRATRETVTPQIDAAVLTALAKLPADRYATVDAFAAALAAPPATYVATASSSPTLARARVAWIAAALIACAATFFLGRARGGASHDERMQFGQTTQVTWEPGLEIVPAISPDGKQVAYVAGNGTQSRIFVRPVAGGRASPLTDDTLAIESQPQWSHDGTRMLYLHDGLVYSAPAGGGVPRQEVPRRSREIESATWSPDARKIAYVSDDSVFVHDVGGASHLVTTMVQPSLCTWGPSHLVACAAGNRWYLKPGMAFGNLGPSWIAIIDVNTRQVHVVTDSTFTNEAPVWSKDGSHVLFVSDRDGVADIYSIAVNDDGAPGGTPTRLTVGLNVSSFTLSADGSRLAYAVQTTSSNIWSQPFAPSAPNTPPRATQLTFGQQIIEGVAVTKDAQWLYYDSNVSGNPDLYRLHLPSGQPERLTTERSPEFNPSLSPDGRSVAFHSWRTGSRDIFVMPLDGGPVVQVTKTPVQEQHATWSPDGQSLAFASQSQPLGIFIARKDASGTWQTRRRLAEGHWEAWSPDGKSISFATELNGAGGLRVLSVDSGAPRALFDEHAPGAPSAEVSVWSDDGRTIYFKSHTARGAVSIWSVPAAGGVPVHVTDLADGTQTDRFGFGLAQGRVFFVHYDRQSNIWVMDVTH